MIRFQHLCHPAQNQAVFIFKFYSQMGIFPLVACLHEETRSKRILGHDALFSNQMLQLTTDIFLPALMVMATYYYRLHNMNIR